jgi:hypothetical protein
MTAAYTVETLQQLRFAISVYPSYSPELALSDSHLFGSLDDILRNLHSSNDHEIKG